MTTPQAGDGLWSLKACAAPDDVLEGPEHCKHLQGWCLLEFSSRKKRAGSILTVMKLQLLSSCRQVVEFYHVHSPAGYPAVPLVLILSMEPQSCCWSPGKDLHHRQMFWVWLVPSCSVSMAQVGATAVKAGRLKNFYSSFHPSVLPSLPHVCLPASYSLPACLPFSILLSSLKRSKGFSRAD